MTLSRHIPIVIRNLCSWLVITVFEINLLHICGCLGNQMWTFIKFWGLKAFSYQCVGKKLVCCVQFPLQVGVEQVCSPDSSLSPEVTKLSHLALFHGWVTWRFSLSCHYRKLSLHLFPIFWHSQSYFPLNAFILLCSATAPSSFPLKLAQVSAHVQQRS